MGLTENASTLYHWMVAGPEIARVVSEFERSVKPPQCDVPSQHHEHTLTNQNASAKDVKSLTRAIRETGTHLHDKTGELFCILRM